MVCNSATRVCVHGCGGEQTYYRGFDKHGFLLPDDETKIDGVWECMKLGCGKRDLQYRVEDQDPPARARLFRN